MALDDPADLVPYSVAPFDGVPVACSSASGNGVQPCAGANVTVATAWFVDCGTSRNVSLPASSSAKSVAGLGADAVPSAPPLAATYVWSALKSR